VLHRTRRLVRLSAPLLAVALLPATAANAASPSAHLVSLDQARKALPATSDMPGRPQTVITTSDPVFSNGSPCPAPDAKPLVLKQSHLVTNIYEADPTSLNAIPVQFTLTAVVFHTTAAARVGMGSILHIETHCPKHEGDSEASMDRTLSQSYQAKGWSGWRSVAHLTVAPDPTDPGDIGLAARINTEYLLRGNVVLILIESGPLTPGNGPQQEAARKQASTAMLAGFAKL
jgi:hypothetical protein